MLDNLNASAIDLFCGIGGLSYGLKKAGIKVKAGIDIDMSCKYAFEKNVKAKFIDTDISQLQGENLLSEYWHDEKEIKVLVGCAPCQPFSSHSNKNKEKEKNEKWNLLNHFKRLITETNPQIISMENVPNLSNQKIFKTFLTFLKANKYYVTYSNVYCPDYGIPQKRRRLVLLGSKLREIEILPVTHKTSEYKSTRQAIGYLPPVKSGEIHKNDPLHRASKLSDINLNRIKASKPNGTWLDWEKRLRLKCHRKNTGKTYKSVYGRMSWDEPSPTITTQFYNFGTGRFGHPQQNRALTIREAAILQSFPENYNFYESEEDITMKKLATHIGNAVPVDLGFVIGKTIIKHIQEFYAKGK